MIVYVLILYQKSRIRAAEHTSAAVRHDAVVVGIMTCTRSCIVLSVVGQSLKAVTPSELSERMSAVTAYCRTH